MKFFYLFILLFNTIVFSQTNSGKVIYKSYLPESKKLDSTKLDSEIYKDFNLMIESAKKLEFELNYNDSYS